MENLRTELDSALRAARQGDWIGSSTLYGLAIEELGHISSRGIEESASSSDTYHKTVRQAIRAVDSVYQKITSLKQTSARTILPKTTEAKA